MRRRQFITLLGGAAAWPFAVRAQQPTMLDNLVDNSSVPLTDNDFSPDVPMGPLVVSSDNSRYFAKPDGTCILFQGSHNWSNGQEWSAAFPATTLFDFDAYTDYMQSVGSTFIRLWMAENPVHFPGEPATIYFSPLPWNRSGGGTAADGLARFDLTDFNSTYFNRVRTCCQTAASKGLYVSIMLFDGWSTNAKDTTPNPWTYHPLKSNNNSNSLDGDPSSTGEGDKTKTDVSGSIYTSQLAYVDHLIDAVNDLDNVLYEICNETGSYSVTWQKALIDHIHSYESGLAKQHPVIFTGIWENSDTGAYSYLTSSNAEAIAPSSAGNPGGGDWEGDRQRTTVARSSSSTSTM